MRKFLAVLILLAWAQTAQADGNNFGSVSYLQQGAGSRAAGLGGAFVALADDATAGYWNPAGLGQMDLYMYEVGSQYAFLANGMSDSFLSYGFQWPEVGNFSIAWVNFTVGEVEGRDDAGNALSNFNSSENTFILSYGRKVFDWIKGLSVGANLKILQHGLGGSSAWGHGLDVGLLWQPSLVWDHTIGVNLQNLAQRLYWNTSGNTIDTSVINVKLGAALKFFPSEEQLYYHHLIATFDADLSEYSRFTPHMGAEVWFIQSLGVRAGYTTQEVTAGASYRPDYYEIDYAFVYDLSDLAAHQHRVSVQLRFK